MYVGHLAAGLALKARVPRAPTWALLAGVALLDLLFPLFLLAGIERAHATPGQSPGFALDFIDWSHSLAMSAAWALLAGLCFFRRGAAVAAAVGAAVFSHFVLDLFMHPPDLALWPYARVHLGLGLWQRWPIGWWFFELAVIAACAAYYGVQARRDGRFGGRAGWSCVVLLILHAGNSPWLMPS